MIVTGSLPRKGDNDCIVISDCVESRSVRFNGDCLHACSRHSSTLGPGVVGGRDPHGSPAASGRQLCPIRRHRKRRPPVSGTLYRREVWCPVDVPDPCVPIADSQVPSGATASSYTYFCC